MLVLVTGATGFLGSHVVRQLLDRGDEVRVLVRTTSDRTRLDGLTAGRPVADAIGDVTDEASVVAAVEGVDAVIHCAAMVEFGPTDPSRIERVNIGGARHVLGAAAEAGVRAVHVSSLAAYGPTESGKPAKDETWWAPDPLEVAYERTKRAAHTYARELAEGGASIRIVAPGGIYGHGDSSTMSQLIEVFSRWFIPIGYLPEVRQTTVNVDDCADAILRVLDADADHDGEEYVLGSEFTTISEWVGMIARAGGHRPPLVDLPTRWVRALGRPGGKVAGWFGQSPDMVRETVAVATHDSAYTGHKMRTTLGWAPRRLEDGMQEMADALKADRATKKRP